MEYLKIKTVLAQAGQACKVEVLEKTGEREKNKFGGYQTAYNIKLNDGEVMKWYASDIQVKNMKEVACNPFYMKRWDKDGKTGFNLFPEGDINIQPQNVEPALSHAEIERKVEAKQDDFQWKVSRGAAWNNAFAYCLKDSKQNAGSYTIDQFCEKVANVAEQIAPYQKAFVNGETEGLPKIDTTPAPYMTNEPPHTEEDAPPIEDNLLPF